MWAATLFKILIKLIKASKSLHIIFVHRHQPPVSRCSQGYHHLLRPWAWPLRHRQRGHSDGRDRDARHAHHLFPPRGEIREQLPTLLRGHQGRCPVSQLLMGLLLLGKGTYYSLIRSIAKYIGIFSKTSTFFISVSRPGLVVVPPVRVRHQQDASGVRAQHLHIPDGQSRLHRGTRRTTQDQAGSGRAEWTVRTNGADGRGPTGLSIIRLQVST